MAGTLDRSNLSELLPYLSEGFCNRCKAHLETRLQTLNLNSNEKVGGFSLSNGYECETSADYCSADSSRFWSPEKSSASSTNVCHQNRSSRTSSGQTSVMGQGHATDSSPASVSSRRQPVGHQISSGSSLHNGFNKLSLNVNNGAILAEERNPRLPQEENELTRMSEVWRKKDFVCVEKINGKPINVLQGLELHTHVFNDEEQQKIVDYVYNLQQLGQAGKLSAPTYTGPRKWMRGKGRVTIQFGCCYNYAVDKNGNPLGIIRDEAVDPIPPLFKLMIKRLVKWNVLPPSCIPNSCIVNIYDEGDCIPPHIDHHDFVRPFCTVSFLTESNILFGSNIKIVGPGEFFGPATIPLPLGSVLILKGNGADVAKHCVPAVRGKRISITFRKMDVPFKFSPDPELQGIQPLTRNSPTNIGFEAVKETSICPIQFQNDDFPPLGVSNTGNRPRSKRN